MTRPIPQVIRYVSILLKGHRLQVSLNTIVGILLVVIDLAFVWSTKIAVDVATHHTTCISLRQSFGLIACIMLLRIVLSLSSRWIKAVLGVKAQNSMQQYIFARLLHGEWTALKAYHTGNLTNRLENDVKDVVNFTTETIPSFFITLTQFIGAFFLLFFMDRSLAIIIVCIVPFFVVSSKLYIKKMRKITHEARDKDSKIQSILQETLQNALVVKTLQRTDYFTKKLQEQQSLLHNLILQRTRYSTISSSFLNFGFATGYFVTFVWGAINLSENAISYGAMLAFIQLVGQIQGPVSNLAKFVPIFITSFTATERLMDIEDIPQEEQKDAVTFDVPLGANIRDVKFQYTSKSRLIFNNFNYSFPAGSVTAVVGETGAGKTTLIRLLLSLIKPIEGRVELTDTTGNSYEMHSYLRNNFAYVPQGNTLFSGTIRNNLLQANPKATDDQLREALHIAAADFVFRKSDGLNTMCGEAGGGLSEGQAQRIAIARALLSNGNIFIFDEATSSLDPKTEELVLQRIISHYPQRTLIFITHRPLVLKYASQILSL